MKQKVFKKKLINMEEYERINKLIREDCCGFEWFPEYEITQDFVDRIQKFVDTIVFIELLYNGNFDECIVIYKD